MNGYEIRVSLTVGCIVSVLIMISGVIILTNTCINGVIINQLRKPACHYKMVYCGWNISCLLMYDLDLTVLVYILNVDFKYVSKYS